jgi:hypothetical protein
MSKPAHSSNASVLHRIPQVYDLQSNNFVLLRNGMADMMLAQAFKNRVALSKVSTLVNHLHDRS